MLILNLLNCHIQSLQLQIILLNQDDSSKCTAQKLVKFELAMKVRKFRRDSIVLNPLSKTLLSPVDKSVSEFVCAVDCSWENIHQVAKLNSFHSNYSRRLPNLLAGNPTNYSKLGKLSTAEAFAGCAYILGNKKLSIALMNKFKWGHTFLELNAEPLEDYSRSTNQEEIMKIEKDYFLQEY